jgi:hypothetical protein
MYLPSHRRGHFRAFSEKVGTGFPKENATNQESRALSDSLEAESALVTHLSAMAVLFPSFAKQVPTAHQSLPRT